ncbi:right-handed parallel beta-helix repeat-containing protein [Paludifilum halophilum]|uniref:Right handed beta helix domain-containing protein n=1 Tax=Paludifilum halophilum TaxID=1642702 RepID=A0A235B9J0_9BACL|nr:right-handed parallel beta-helix repeat-containing protein [Paludifilum halophilum]OYD08954.1 hypothetical protein CHM34_04040 [Paludifilum halophilum]
MSGFKKIEVKDSLVDWSEKFNHNTDESTDLKRRMDILETGETVDNELIALRDSTAFSFTGTTADERVENAEGELLADRERIDRLESRLLPMINVKDKGAVGDGVTDDSPAIQAALDEAREQGGGEVQVPPGTYAIRATLLIYSRTRLRLSPAAKIVRDAELGNMLRSGIGNIDGYQGVHDVEVTGGEWDSNARRFPSPVTSLSFGHCEYITIRDTKVTDVYHHHCVELNAVRHGKVVHCIFDGYSGTRYSEAVQIDLMKSASQYPAYGNYDNTPCDDILIAYNTFTRWSRGFGSHSATTNIYHTNVRVIGNHFKELTGQGIRGYNYRDCTVVGNTFENCRMGIEMRNAETTAAGHYTIAHNTFRRMNGEDLGFGIWLNGFSEGGKTYWITDAVITGNVIEETNNDGIYLDYCTRVQVIGNVIRRAGDQGISVYRIEYSTLAQNRVEDVWEYGIAVNESSDNHVIGNFCRGGNRKGDDEIPGIGIHSGSDRNHVQGNLCRMDATGSRPDYGIRITNTCNDNLVTNNDLYRSGTVSSLRDTGNGTVTTAGNRE